MTNEKLINLFNGYGIKLNANDVAAEEMPEELKGLPYHMVPREIFLSHVAYMCEKGVDYVQEGRIEKAMRWLGFVQYSFYCTGFCTIDDLKEHSRPDPVSEPILVLGRAYDCPICYRHHPAGPCENFKGSPTVSEAQRCPMNSDLWDPSDPDERD